MANIKVSEMTEASTFDDGDYAMIVQANQNKKILKENMLGQIPTIQEDISIINNNIGDLEELLTGNTNDIVDAINSIIPVVLYENENGTITTAQLLESALNYYVIIIEWIATSYTDFLKKETSIIILPENNTYSKTSSFYNTTNNQIYSVSAVYTIADNVISIDTNRTGTVGANTAYNGNSNVFAITKVVGLIKKEIKGE